MRNWVTDLIAFVLGMIVMLLLIIGTIHIHNAIVIKQYTEGKIVCTTLADEFICREVGKGD
jgi:hypothetical protein